MTVNINNTEIDMSLKFRAEMLFEDVLGHSFAGQSIKEWVTYFFCTVIALTKDGFISFDDFITWMDDNPTTLYEFIQWYTDAQKRIMELRTAQIAKDVQKKTKKKQSK